MLLKLRDLNLFAWLHQITGDITINRTIKFCFRFRYHFHHELRIVNVPEHNLPCSALLSLRRLASCVSQRYCETVNETPTWLPTSPRALLVRVKAVPVSTAAAVPEARAPLGADVVVPLEDKLGAGALLFGQLADVHGWVSRLCEEGKRKRSREGMYENACNWKSVYV